MIKESRLNTRFYKSDTDYTVESVGRVKEKSSTINIM